jgi:hypothetical protein
LQQLWASSAGKWALGVIALGVAGGAAYRLSRSDAPSSLREAPAESVARSVAPPQAVTAPSAPTADGSPSPAPSGASDVAPPKPAHTRAEKSPSVQAASGEPTIDEEVKLVSGAQAALRSGNASQALELLAQDAARFPNGKLATLRQVTHMMALCQSGQRAQAQKEAADFVAARPNSPFVERVNRICP